jgi:hypothetical protein
MKHRLRHLTNILLAILLSGMLSFPGSGRAEPTFQVIPAIVNQVSPIPYPVCAGDQLPLMVMVLAVTPDGPPLPLPYGQMSVITSGGSIGAVQPSSIPIQGGIASFTYHAPAEQPGNRSETLSFVVNGYPASGLLPVLIYPCDTYNLNLVVIQEVEDSSGLQLTWIFSAAGQLERQGDVLSGAGSAETFLSMKGDFQVMQCGMEPPIEGSTTFQAEGRITDLAPGSQWVTMNLDFASMPVKGGKIQCAGIDGIKVEYPIEPGVWEANELGLRDMAIQLYGNSGSTSITASGIHGRLSLHREVLP